MNRHHKNEWDGNCFTVINFKCNYRKWRKISYYKETENNNDTDDTSETNNHTNDDTNSYTKVYNCLNNNESTKACVSGKENEFNI